MMRFTVDGALNKRLVTLDDVRTLDGRVVVELDGYAFHSDRGAFQEDRRRDRELALQGDVVLRFTADEVLREPRRVVAAVRGALATARRTPPHV